MIEPSAQPLATLRGGLGRLVVSGCLAVAVLGAACGKKGPPLPPLARVPAAPTEVTAVRSGDQVTIRFTVPRANITNMQPADIERVDVYAWTGANLANTQIFRRATVVASVPVRRPPPPPEPAEEGEPAPPPPPPSTEPGLDQGAIAEVTETLTPSAYEVLQLPEERPKGPAPSTPKLAPPDLGPPLPPPLQRYYVVVGVNRGGTRGAPAARVGVPLWPAPPPPTGLTAAVREGGVDLAWEPAAARRAPVYAGPAARPSGPAPGASAGSPAVPRTPESNSGPRAPSAVAPQAAAAATAASASSSAPAGSAASALAAPVSGESAPVEAEAPESGATTGMAAGSGAPEGTPVRKPLPARLIYPWTAWTTGYLVLEMAPPTLGAPAAPPPAAQPFPQRLTPSPVGATKFTDPRVEFGAERCYTVRSVETFGTLSVESDNSVPACIKPSDVFPPAAPKSLAAVASPGAISLIWEANTEPDLGGYLVYRGVVPGGDLEPLTPKPIRETTYRDATVTPGTRYVYVVVAVDASTPPNMSERSNPVEETAR